MLFIKLGCIHGFLMFLPLLYSGYHHWTSLWSIMLQTQGRLFRRVDGLPRNEFNHTELKKITSDTISFEDFTHRLRTLILGI
jgi:hypothetical protein